MNLSGKNIGFAMTGSFCTFDRTIKELKKVVETGANVIPIMSETASSTDTRFGKAEDFVNLLEELCGGKVVKTVRDAEPFGPKAILDLLIVAPCTGNSLAKIANGIADSSVTMAVKAHLRNKRPVLIAVSTNDGLANAAKNIGSLLNYKNIYFVPFGQDDCVKKPNSLIADMSKLIPAAELALEDEQIQPLLC
ncbi:MAG: dipicolinate synthase subunit B [Clostridia bacterium]|nr:dipicolinate synthase subunit B [Clostridia bacterium]